MELTATLPALRLAAAADETDDWATIVERHNHRVVLFLLSRGLKLDRARELTQETWTRLLAQHKEGRFERLDMPGLALRQAWFLVMDDLRRSGTETTLEDEHISLPDPAASPERRLLSREQLNRARAALEKCSPRARSIFQLVYENPGTPHADVAAQLGLSVQRVRQTLCEVRAAIRSSLEDADV